MLLDIAIDLFLLYIAIYGIYVIRRIAFEG